VPGLRWSDLNQVDTPAMWDLAGHALIGSMVVRGLGSRTCPTDGWLMVSTGSSAAADTDCGAVDAPRRTAFGAKIPDLAGVRVQSAPSDPAGPVWGRIGALGEAIHADGGCTNAVGPGAAVGLADASGAVDYYAPDVRSSNVAAWTRCPITAVDDPINQSTQPNPVTSEPRRAGVRAADSLVRQVLAKAPARSRIVLAGLSDDAGPAHLHVALVEDGAGSGYLGSTSTRRRDVVVLPELAATLKALADQSGPLPAVGDRPGWTSTRPRPGALAPTAAEFTRHDVAGVTTESIRTAFVAGLTAATIVVFAVATALIWRRPTGDGLARRLTAAAAAVCAAVPVASLLAGLVPWSGTSHPALSMLSVTLLVAGLIAALALGRRDPPDALRMIVVLAGTTVVVVAADLILGLSLQLDNPLGYTEVEGARYYGMGNIVFAVFATALLILAATVASWGQSRKGWHPLTAVALVIAAGLAGVALDGLPGWGSDFGGVIALIPATGVTALLIAQRRVSVPRLAALGAAGAGAVLALAFADHARGAAQETHLGRFAGQLLSGQAAALVDRKLHAVLLPLAVIPVVVASTWLAVVLKPGWFAAARELTRSMPGLRAGLAGAATIALVGSVVNDSGAIVAGSVLLIAAPLTITAILGRSRAG